ncbi:MAG: hypothetical protein FWD40_10005 [Treponema sp.]|nr:hypothetical protein [Treponema sp.]
MSFKSPHPCLYSGCSNTVPSSYFQTHFYYPPVRTINKKPSVSKRRNHSHAYRFPLNYNVEETMDAGGALKGKKKEEAGDNANKYLNLLKNPVNIRLCGYLYRSHVGRQYERI